MCRTCQWWLLACAVLFMGGGATTLGAEDPRSLELCRQLEQPEKFPGFDDPKTTFSEALESLAMRYNLSFDINEEAFKDAAREEDQKTGKSNGSPLWDVERMEIATPKPIPEMHTRLRHILKKTLSRVSPSATYIVRDGLIEVTTTEAIRKEFFADRPPGLLPPLVSGSFDKMPLQTALKGLAGSGNIVLDSRAVKEAAAPVTAEFTNVPLDTAVRMLADMAGLKMVPMENVLYVTSLDNARSLLEEQEKVRLQRQKEKEDKPSKPAGKPDKPAPQPAPPKVVEATPGIK